MKLYNFDLSPQAARCRLAIRNKGLAVEKLPPPAGGRRRPEFLAINPIGRAPVLVLEDGSAIPESEVIGEYWEDRWPSPTLRPASPEGRARMRLLVRLRDVHLMPTMGKLFRHINPRGRGPTVMAAACAVASGFSLADCALVLMLFLLDKLRPGFGVPADSAATMKTGGCWARVRTDGDVAAVMA
ncbi:MAG: glutathione S-transferase family protein [Geminicoccaceae bacterium]